MSFPSRFRLSPAVVLGLLMSGAGCGPELNPFDAVGDETTEAAGSGASAGSVSDGGGSGGATARGGAESVPFGGVSTSAGSGGEEAAGRAGADALAGEGGGGASMGGAQGSAGEPSVVVDPDSLCYGKTHVPEPLLSDFEHGPDAWFAYLDDHEVAVGEQHPGAAGTNSAAHFAGGKAAAAGVGIGMFCDDVSGFDGVSFWAKGHGGEHVRFLVAIPATDASPGRGDCNPEKAKCNDHPGLGITLTGEWKLYTVPWSKLEQYGWGTPAQFAGIANSLLWINDGPVESFEFAIDEVKLY
jgi:hypothetical protein